MNTNAELAKALNLTLEMLRQATASNEGLRNANGVERENVRKMREELSAWQQRGRQQEADVGRLAQLLEVATARIEALRGAVSGIRDFYDSSRPAHVMAVAAIEKDDQLACAAK